MARDKAEALARKTALEHLLETDANLDMIWFCAEWDAMCNMCPHETLTHIPELDVPGVECWECADCGNHEYRQAN